jgi:predicted 2-oxoglutarate/Fe(II)-dependent dioxygenase YbiX
MYEEIKQKGHILLVGDKCPLTINEFKEIEKITSCIKYERISKGDAGDSHRLQVARFRLDIDEPEDLSPLSTNLMDILNSEKMKLFYRSVTNFDTTCIRRAQSHILGKGDYVGIHIDGEGNSEKYPGSHLDYKYAIVLHFRLTYEGGDTVLYPTGNKKQIALPEYSMLIIPGSLPHEVLPIKEGERKSLAYFLSDNFGPSKVQ